MSSSYRDYYLIIMGLSMFECSLIQHNFLQLDCSSVDGMDSFNSSTLKENTNEVAAFVKDSSGITDAIPVVNDTLDELQGILNQSFAMLR